MQSTSKPERKNCKDTHFPVFLNSAVVRLEAGQAPPCLSLITREHLCKDEPLPVYRWLVHLPMQSVQHCFYLINIWIALPVTSPQCHWGRGEVHRGRIWLCYFWRSCTSVACRKPVWGTVCESCSMEQGGGHCPVQASTLQVATPGQISLLSHSVQGRELVSIAGAWGVGHSMQEKNLCSDKLTWMWIHFIPVHCNGVWALYRYTIKCKDSWFTESLTNPYLRIDFMISS